jgi:hypothetical protein
VVRCSRDRMKTHTTLWGLISLFFSSENWLNSWECRPLVLIGGSFTWKMQLPTYFIGQSCVLHPHTSELGFSLFYVYTERAGVCSRIHWEIHNIVMHLILQISSTHSWSLSNKIEFENSRAKSQNWCLQEFHVRQFFELKHWNLSVYWIFLILFVCSKILKKILVDQ